MTQTMSSYKVTPCLCTSKVGHFPKLFPNDNFIWYLHQCYEVNSEQQHFRKEETDLEPVSPQATQPINEFLGKTDF